MILGGCLGVGKRFSRTETSMGFTVAASTRTRIWSALGVGLRDLFVHQDLGPAVLVDTHRFHRRLLAPPRCRLALRLYPRGGIGYLRCGAQAGSEGSDGCRRPRRTLRSDVPYDEADAAEHDHEGQKGGEHEAR